MKFLKQHWFLFTILFISIVRFFLSYQLPSFYIKNLAYDDAIMINQMSSLLSHIYLGPYNEFTLIKGVFFPLVLALSKMLTLSFSSFFTLLYLLASLYFLWAMKHVIKDKKYLLLIYTMILFNPISFSSEVFQRMYRNTLSLSELLFFLGSVIQIIHADKHRIFHFISLGMIISCMYLTREDSIWIVVVLLFVFVYTIFKNKTWKTLFLWLIPVFLLNISLNIVSYINNKHYQIYSYNEMQTSKYKEFYLKLLQIKDEEQIDKVSLPKSTIYKVAKELPSFSISVETLDSIYNQFTTTQGQFDNGRMIWYLRNWLYHQNKFQNAQEAEDFFEKLCVEMDDLFEKGIFEKEWVIPSVFLSTPSWNELSQIPMALLESVIYTTTYQNVKTFSANKLLEVDEKNSYDSSRGLFEVYYNDYANAENMVDSNIASIEIIRMMYQIFTMIGSVVALVIYFKNIRKSDSIHVILHLIVCAYLIILGGVVYTHVTAFSSIRYRYFANLYILQSLFILLNCYRIRLCSLKKNKA